MKVGDTKKKKGAAGLKKDTFQQEREQALAEGGQVAEGQSVGCICASLDDVIRLGDMGQEANTTLEYKCFNGPEMNFNFLTAY